MDWNRIFKLAGVDELVEEFQVVLPVDTSTLTEKKLTDEEDEEDSEAPTEVKVARMVDRYHRANPLGLPLEMRNDPAVIDAKRQEQNDAFAALSAMLGGPHLAVRRLLGEETETPAEQPKALKEEKTMNFDRLAKLAGVEALPKAEPVLLTETDTVEETPVEEVTPDEPLVEAEEVKVDVIPDDIKDVPVNEPPKAEHDSVKPKKVKVPAAVSAAITSRISELKASIEQFEDKEDSVKYNAIDALEKIADELKLENGYTAAQIYFGTLMSQIVHLFPPKVVKFLAQG